MKDTEIGRALGLLALVGAAGASLVEEAGKAHIDIDRVYALKHEPGEPIRPWVLQKWIENGTILKEVGRYQRMEEAVDRYALDIKYQIR